MNDNDDDLPEEIKLIAEKSVEIITILSDIENAAVISKIISVAISNVLCSRMASEDAAHKMLDMIMSDVDSAVMTTMKHGFTSWVEGTPH